MVQSFLIGFFKHFICITLQLGVTARNKIIILYLVCFNFVECTHLFNVKNELHFLSNFETLYWVTHDFMDGIQNIVESFA